MCSARSVGQCSRRAPQGRTWCCQMQAGAWWHCHLLRREACWWNIQGLRFTHLLSIMLQMWKHPTWRLWQNHARFKHTVMTLALHKPCISYWILDQKVMFRKGKINIIALEGQEMLFSFQYKLSDHDCWKTQKLIPTLKKWSVL